MSEKTTAEHTPGPWRLHRRSHQQESQRRDCQSGGPMIPDLRTRLERLPRLTPVQYSSAVVGNFARMAPHAQGEYVKRSDVLAVLASVPTAQNPVDRLRADDVELEIGPDGKAPLPTEQDDVWQRVREAVNAIETNPDLTFQGIRQVLRAIDKAQAATLLAPH